MCLIVIAHRVSARYPLVIAANRDEDYERPTRAAQWWEEAADVLGGRDGLHGGSWLAMTRAGRFAAVTNLRGALRTPESRSRGELVSGFARGSKAPDAYVREIAGRRDQYAGFHLIAGQLDGELAVLSSEAESLPPGVHGFSNAPAGVVWPKVESAVESIRGALECGDATQVTAHLLKVLHASVTHRDPTRDIFISGERYGTRSSTVIVATADEVSFVEQSFKRGGGADGAPQRFTFPRS